MFEYLRGKVEYKKKEEINFLEVAEETPVLEVTPKKRGRKKKEESVK